MPSSPKLRNPPSRKQVQSELAFRSLSHFVRQGWGVVEPGTQLIWNWHLDIICTALELQSSGSPEHRRLLIMVPPGTMKSLLVSVFAPAWEWLHTPERRKMFLANDHDLAVRDSRRTREVITSEWYRDLVKYVAKRNGTEAWTLAEDQNEKVNFENTRRGFRQCRSLLAQVTGKRADDIVIDDPIDAKDVVNGSGEQVSRRLQECANVIEKALPSRVNDLRFARWTVIMQRLHENDTAGRALREGGWNVIRIPMEYECGHPLNHKDDPRLVSGELMFPERFPQQQLEELKSPMRLGIRHYSAQYQQEPKPDDGTYILRAWYDDSTRYDGLPLVKKYMASDLAVTEPADGRDPDYTEHGVFGFSRDEPKPGEEKSPDSLFVCDWWHKQATADVWIDAGLDLVSKHKPSAWFIEAGVIRRAIEPFLIKRMRERGIHCRIEWVPSISDKATRGRAFQARSAMRLVRFPRSSDFAERIIQQCVDFPGGLHDDAFDTMSLICLVIDQAHPAIVREKPQDRPRDHWRRENESKPKLSRVV